MLCVSQLPTTSSSGCRATLSCPDTVARTPTLSHPSAGSVSIWPSGGGSQTSGRSFVAAAHSRHPSCCSRLANPDCSFHCSRQTSRSGRIRATSNYSSLPADADISIWAAGDHRIRAAGGWRIRAAGGWRIRAAGKHRIRAAGNHRIRAAGGWRIRAAGGWRVRAAGGRRIRPAAGGCRIRPATGGRGIRAATSQRIRTAASRSRIWAAVWIRCQACSCQACSYSCSGSCTEATGQPMAASFQCCCQQLECTAATAAAEHGVWGYSSSFKACGQASLATATSEAGGRPMAAGGRKT